MLRSLFGAVAATARVKNAERNMQAAMRSLDAGELPKARDFAEAALRAEPESEEATLLLADVHRLSGDLKTAKRIVREVAERSPANADAREMLATILQQSGDRAAAETTLLEVLRLDPTRVRARNDLAKLLIERKQFANAAQLLRYVLKHAPDLAAAQGNMAIAQHFLGRSSEAMEHFRVAIRLSPNDLGILNNYALLLRDLGRIDDAARILQQALSLARDHPKSLIHLATVLRDLGRSAEVLDEISALVARRPNDELARCALANIYLELGERQAATEQLNCALADPQSPDVRFVRSMHLLALENFEEGWHEYEARYETDESPRRGFPFPDWDGESLAAKSVLVYAEQGIGDEIMFASCLPDLISAARRCVIECDPRLERLFARSFPQAKVFGNTRSGDRRWLASAGEIDVKVAVGSLPLRYRTSATSFPVHAGYLRADRERVALFRARLAALGEGKKVGIAWRGGLGKTRRAVRSIAPQHWERLFARTDVQFVSLQHGPVEEDLAAFARLARAATLHHWSETIADIDELAALMNALDSIVTVCNTAVHLGGALGLPVVALVPFSPEWRYLYSGTRMPWYPSVELLRQATPGDWSAVLAEVSRRIG